MKPRWDTFEVSESARFPELQGRRVGEIARERGVSPLDVMCEVALAENLETRFRAYIANDEVAEVAQLLGHDHVVLGLSDAGAHIDQLCDVPLPTDLLGTWVRDRAAMPLERAVRKLTGEPADIYGFVRRGYLREGNWADVCVFDPATVGTGPIRRVRDFPADAERLTAEEPTGVRHVLVNGTPIRGTACSATSRPMTVPARDPSSHEPSGARAAASTSERRERAHCRRRAGVDMNSVVVVTGAGGMGEAIARRLASGRAVVLADFSVEQLERTGAQLEALGHAVHLVRTDVSSAVDVEALARASAQLGSIGAVVHTAGVSPVQASVEQIVAVDVLGTAHVLDAFEAHVEPGTVAVCIASMAGTMMPVDADTLRLFATTRTAELAALPVLDPATLDPGSAYALAKRANQVRVEAASVAWAGAVGGWCRSVPA